MVDCCQRAGIEQEFDARTAAQELRRLRKVGPRPTTRMLTDALPRQVVSGGTVLDIGGGVGAISHELLEAGARESLQVDISAGFIDAAREETQRRGHGDRMRFVHADFVDVGGDIPAADVVTLDRVICCYPDVERLVSLSAQKARRLYAAVYPRRVWWVFPAIMLINLWSRIRGSSFRSYLHPPELIDAILEREGLKRYFVRDTFIWRVAAYLRPG
jgi:magnesium-protoporphyrin O-methyltransferase